MISVKLFGKLKAQLKVKDSYEAGTLNELLKLMEKDAGVACVKLLKRSIIFINDENILNLKGFKTKLKPNDHVVFLSPVSGG